MGWMGTPNPQNCPFCLRHMDPIYYTHAVTDPTHLPPNDSSITARSSTQLYNKVSIGYNGTPKIHPQNCSFPFDDHYHHLIHASLDWPHSPSSTVSIPFSRFVTVHFTPDRQTDAQTDRWCRRQVSKNTMYAHYTDRERRTNNNKLPTTTTQPPIINIKLYNGLISEMLT